MAPSGKKSSAKSKKKPAAKAGVRTAKAWQPAAAKKKSAAARTPPAKAHQPPARGKPAAKKPAVKLKKKAVTKKRTAARAGRNQATAAPVVVPVRSVSKTSGGKLSKDVVVIGVALEGIRRPHGWGVDADAGTEPLQWLSVGPNDSLSVGGHADLMASPLPGNPVILPKPRKPKAAPLLPDDVVIRPKSGTLEVGPLSGDVVTRWGKRPRR
ncbi:MAG: hypothetical protein P4L83_25015 [Nevskia sp.]|nr:hypothetical protein [Nevskia sp.]